MKTGIMGYFTSANFRFDVSAKAKKKIMESIDEQILTPFPLPKVKAQTLEILLNTDGKSTERKTEKISKTDSAKNLSFMFYLPYSKIVIHEVLDLQAFTEEFFEALKEILLPYDIAQNVVEDCKKSVLAEMIGKEEYLFKLNPSEKQWREVAKNLQGK